MHVGGQFAKVTIAEITKMSPTFWRWCLLQKRENVAP